MTFLKSLLFALTALILFVALGFTPKGLRLKAQGYRFGLPWENPREEIQPQRRCDLVKFHQSLLVNTWFALLVIDEVVAGTQPPLGLRNLFRGVDPKVAQSGNLVLWDATPSG